MVCPGMAERSWLWHCATNRKVAAWVPGKLIDIYFQLTKSLASTRPLAEISTIKGGRAASKADSLTWDSRRLTNLRFSTACYRLTDDCPSL